MLTACLRTGLALLLALTGVFTRPALAQSRADDIARRQQEKAQTAAPDPLTKAEAFFERFEKGQWFVGPPRGWYPALGSVYPGGGMAGGAGYRRYIGYDSFVDASGMYSIRNYKRVQIVASTPNHAKQRVDLAGGLSWIDAPSVHFFGLGNDSRPEGRATYGLQRTRVEGSAVVRAIEFLRLRVDGGLDRYAQSRGRGPDPSIEELYSPAAVPVLGADQTYLRGDASATLAWLQSPQYSRTGGSYRLGYEEFNPLTGSGGTFGLARTELIQHVPIMRETWVLSLRGRVESVLRKSDVVPYYLMPNLGGGDTLRAYSTMRFRDRHSLLMTGEVRWFPNRLGIDMAMFFDAGKVAPRRSALTFDGLKTDYGIGIRFHTPTTTALRIDVARGSEGTRLVFTSSAPF